MLRMFLTVALREAGLQSQSEHVQPEMRVHEMELDEELVKDCGHTKTTWCACKKFRDYYDSEHDGDTPDPVSN